MKTIMNAVNENFATYQSVVITLIVGTLIWAFRSGIIFGTQSMRLGHHRRLRFPPKSGMHPNTMGTTRFDSRLVYSNGFVEVSGKQIWYQCFKPAKPVAIIVMFHGYGDHSDYIMYQKAHDISLRANCVVFSFDQPGFGRSDGLWGFVPEWFAHVDDCVVSGSLMIAQQLGVAVTLPIFAYGHSMGGGVAITAAMLNEKSYAGLILTAPMCGLVPNLRKHYLIELLFFGLARVFPTLPITPLPELGYLCYKDPDFHEFSKRTNHLNYPGNVRLATAKSMLIAQAWIESNAALLKTPFFILHGDHDFVTSSVSSESLFTQASSLDKQIDILPGYYHSILGPGQPKEMNDHALDRIVNWIQARV